MKINRDQLPDDSVNIPKDSIFLTFLKFTISLTLIVLAISWSLKYLINFGVDMLSQKSATKLTKLTSSYINLGGEEDKNLSKLAENIIECSKLPIRPKIFIIEGKKPNAFAFGDGNIYITKPLLKKAKSDEEMAFVIGHEMGHFKNRDHLKRLGFKLVLMGLDALGLDMSNLVLSSSINFQEAKYSQKAEIKADRFGLKSLFCAYGGVEGAFSIFNKLKVEDKHYSNYLFSSHPSFKERLKLMKRWQQAHSKIKNRECLE